MSHSNIKTALVTGASSGLGYDIAKTLVKEGYRVIGCARRIENLDRLAAEINELAGPSFVSYKCDLANEAEILAMFETIKEQFGRLDVLVNNAGLGHNASLLTGSTEHWKDMLDINVLALCICTREAVKIMRSRDDRGHVIHISSMSGHRDPGGSNMYAATKFAVKSLTESLRLELRQSGSKIHITSISPGLVRTEFAEKYHRDYNKAQDLYNSLEVLEAEDISEIVKFILSQKERVLLHDILVRPLEQKS